jgi:hypothetical protein
MVSLRLVPFKVCLACALLGGAAPAFRLSAQDDPSARAQREARAAQRAFEHYRRRRLPLVPPHGDKCELNIGRFCYWDNNKDRPFPPEPSDITAERERLRTALERSALHAPQDDWVLGQRVRYALEAGDSAAAHALIDKCGGTAWWCAALAGVVWHAEGKESRAAEAFATALGTMPDSLHCSWLDVRPWLPPEAAERASHSSCAELAALGERLFWMASPLFTWRPEAVRNEWFARRTVTSLAEGTLLPSGLAWGDDAAELALRFGWPSSWGREQEPGRLTDPFDLRVIGREPAPSWSLVPTARALASPFTATPEDWVLSGAVAPPMRYAPTGLRRLAPLPVQVARFRRDTAMHLVIVYDVTDSVVRSATAGVPAAVLTVAPDSVLVSARGEVGARRGVFAFDAPRRSALAAVEVVDSVQALAARWRAGIEPLAPDALVSDLLVGRAGDTTAASLEEALPFATASPRVPAGSALLLYWECYAPASPTTPVTVTLRLVPGRPKGIARLFRALGLGRRAAPIALKWNDTGRPDGSPGRSLRLGLPSGTRGRYRLELVVAGDTRRGRATRELMLTER